VKLCGQKMKAISGKGRKAPDRIQRQRRGLLAKVHIAIKELGISDDDYRGILMREFRVGSAAALSIMELQYLVAYFEEKGWEAQGGNRKSKIENRKSQCEALQGRAREIATEMEDGERRLHGLCKKLCGVDRLEWCRDAGQLRRLLAAIGKMKIGDRN